MVGGGHLCSRHPALCPLSIGGEGDGDNLLLWAAGGDRGQGSSSSCNLDYQERKAGQKERPSISTEVEGTGKRKPVHEGHYC